MPLFGADPATKIQKQLFNCKFTSKSLNRESKKCDKNTKAYKKKCKKAMEKGNIEGATIYAENATKEHNKSLKCLRVSERIDAIVYRVNQALQQGKLTKSLTKFLEDLNSVAKTMDVDQISAFLDKMDSQFEDLDLNSQYMETAIDSSICATMPQHQIESLMSQIADEHGLGMPSSNTIGLSVGGSKDINNFRKCISNNIMPSVGSITYNGLFYEYYFDTKKTNYMYNEEKKDTDTMLFYPSYCFGKTKNEYYMTLGLNSNIKQETFKRKHLNLIVVLDQSGSMSSQFYDDTNKSKMEIANEAICGLLNHLTPKDRFGLVTFQSKAQIIRKLEFMETEEVKVNSLKHRILSIKENGGTNFECGYNCAIQLFDELFNDNEYLLNCIAEEYENRIILLTDAQPNIGCTDSSCLLSMVAKYANTPNHRIYTTFIGIGLDFNASLIESISNVRGCNYYSVESTKDFMKRMDEEFEFMVTPLVFNVCLKLESEGNSCEIETVYGRYKDKHNGIITKINTLFPSKKIGGKAKGGVQLIKLKKRDNNIDGINIVIEVSFEDRNNKKYVNTQCIAFKPPSTPNDIIESDEQDSNDSFYDNIGIRKAILLAKYAQLMMEWMNETQNHYNSKIAINDKYKQLFGDFLQYFTKEMKICNDNALQKEVDVMEKLLSIDLATNINENEQNVTSSDLDLEERLKQLQGI